jgi:hypothetical protein
MQTQQITTIPGSQLSPQAITAAIEQNKKLREISGQKVQSLLDQWPEIGPDTDLLSTDKLDADLADAQSKLTSCLTIMENRRKPITRTFDDIRDLFTAEEKAIKGMSETVQNSRILWQKEKIRRDKVRKDEEDNRLIKSAEAVDIAARAKTTYGQNLVRLISENIARVNQKFNEHTADTLPSYRDVLTAWTPGFTQASETYCRQGDPGKWFYHSEDEIKAIREKAFDEASMAAKASYGRDMRMEKDRLLELIPSRIAELIRENQAEIDARLLREEAERKQQAEQQAASVEQSIAVSAEAEKHEQVFTAISEAAPAISVAKGTSQKKKYAPVTIAEHHKILVYWVEKAMSKLSQEDLLKKLSFMRTFADKDLNDGIVIQGVPQVEDVSVRGRRKEDGE